MAETQTQFDPWDWLGVHCGGYFSEVDESLLAFLKSLKRNKLRTTHHDKVIRSYFQLVATLLCNTDAFEFDTDPTQLRWVGDDRFETLDQLIEAWDAWYRERYS